MEQKEMAKTRLIIYVLMAYGLTCLMGILMWYGSTKGYDLTVFPTAQMMYPAAGVTDGSGMQYVKEWIAMFQNPVMWINIVALPINYFFVFIAFSVKNMDGDIICSRFCRNGSDFVPVCLHYLNNNLIPIISGTLSADVLENQNVSLSLIHISEPTRH